MSYGLELYNRFDELMWDSADKGIYLVGRGRFTYNVPEGQPADATMLVDTGISTSIVTYPPLILFPKDKAVGYLNLYESKNESTWKFRVVAGTNITSDWFAYAPVIPTPTGYGVSLYTSGGDLAWTSSGSPLQATSVTPIDIPTGSGNTIRGIMNSTDIEHKYLVGFQSDSSLGSSGGFFMGSSGGNVDFNSYRLGVGTGSQTVWYSNQGIHLTAKHPDYL